MSGHSFDMSFSFLYLKWYCKTEYTIRKPIKNAIFLHWKYFKKLFWKKILLARAKVSTHGALFFCSMSGHFLKVSQNERKSTKLLIILLFIGKYFISNIFRLKKRENKANEMSKIEAVFLHTENRWLWNFEN